MARILLSLICIFLTVTLGCKGRDAANKVSEEPPQVSSDKTQTGVQEETRIEEYQEDVQAEDEKNNPPEVTSIEVETVSPDPRAGFRVVAEGKDSDGDEVSFRYQWKRNGENIPGAIDQVLEWQENFVKADVISIEVAPFDGKDEGVWRSEGSFKIPNSPPRIVSQPEARMEGGKFTYIAKADDPDGDPVEFRIKNALPGMTIEPASGAITWAFDEKDAGEYRIEVIASDPEGAEAVQELRLTIPNE